MRWVTVAVFSVLVRVAVGIVLSAFIVFDLCTPLFVRPTTEQYDASTADAAVARRDLDLLLKKRDGAILSNLDPSLRRAGSAKKLREIDALVPSSTPRRIRQVGYRWNSYNSDKHSQFSYEVLYDRGGIVATIGLHQLPLGLAIEAINVQPISAPLQAINAFTFARKPWYFAALFVLAVLLGLFSAASVWAALFARGVRLRWLWVVVCVIGYGRFSLQWTSGNTYVKPIWFGFPVAEFTRVSWDSPWILSLTLPCAIAFWIWKLRFR